MSNGHAVELHPPRDWQVFEDFCRDLFEAHWGVTAKRHGKSGEDQAGVDVYAQVGGQWIGVQCKKKEPGKKLTPGQIEAEVKKALGFKPTLSKLIFATVDPPSVQAQAKEREINAGEVPACKPPFVVELKFWDELVEMLREHPQVFTRWRRRLGFGISPKIDVNRLPASRSAKLIGREARLAELDQAWANSNTHAISLIAVGGAGKTALVFRWLQTLEATDWGGAEMVFAWSFYSQGAGVNRQASGAQFFPAVFEFLGEPLPQSSDPRAPGVRLAQLIRERHVLLVLDGLEPLQYPPSDARKGKIKDPAVQVLVRELATSQPGLLVLTSRQAVAGLKDEEDTSAPVINLEELSNLAGAELLKTLGVRGKDHELEKVTGEVHGHALTLTLLGTYLKAAHKGDVRAWHDSPLLTQAGELGDEKPFRVMSAYVEWFDENPSTLWQRIRRRLGKRSPSPEGQILSVLGLFDRPADAEALAALRRPPAIPGLTDRLVDLSQSQWNIALKRLRDARLVLEELGKEKEIDAHPLVREHFGRVLATESPEAYRAGHQRLYEHYAAATPDLPDTLEQMEPLYRAIGHGCRAGRRQEVFDEVYRRRVDQGRFGTARIGAFGSSLTALAGLFERTWNRPAEELRPDVRGFLLNEVAICLRALGRLGEAVEPMAAGFELDRQAEDWENAAISAGNLSELTRTLGQVSRSVEVARESVELAERSGDAFMRMVNRTILADALHAAGELSEAEAAFRQAEALQAEDQPHYPKLYSLRGYQYCDLLLARAAPLDGSGLDRAAMEAAGEEARGLSEEVLGRAKLTLSWSTAHGFLLDIALDHLSLGRAGLGLALATGGSLAEAAAELDRAVQGLREAGTEHNLPWGLLARAALHRFAGDAEAARADLTEALEIAERGQMRLHECDAHLEWGRLCWAGGDRAGAEEHLATAAEIVEETGYGRRGREVAELVVAVVLGSERRAIRQTAARHGARNVRLCGSAARGQATRESELDFLVDMEPGRTLLDLEGLRQALEELLGRKVYVATEGGLDPLLRDRVLGAAVPL